MRAAWTTMAALCFTAFLAGCGQGRVVDGDKQTGVHITLNGGTVAMGSIIVQNVFDPSQVQLIDCNQKPELLNGQTFCDEMLVLPPGVYEIKVQVQEQGCATEFDHYKVVVQAGQTVEQQINVICNQVNGGLDVIVKETEVPIVTNCFLPGEPACPGVGFTFAGSGEPANKYVCQCGEPVTITTHVFDSDNTCVDLTGTFAASNASGVSVPGLLIPTAPMLPDMTLPALIPGEFQVFNANNPATVQVQISANNVGASWVGGAPPNSATVNWSFSWNAATQTGTFLVQDANTLATLLSGNVTGLSYNLIETFPGSGQFTGAFTADMLLAPNALGFPAGPVVTRFFTVSDLSEVTPGDPSTLSGTGIADVFPWQFTCVETVPNGGFFSVSVETSIALGLYSVDFTVTDSTGLSSSFQIPIHVIDCGLCPTP